MDTMDRGERWRVVRRGGNQITITHGLGSSSCQKIWKLCQTISYVTTFPCLLGPIHQFPLDITCIVHLNVHGVVKQTEEGFCVETIFMHRGCEASNQHFLLNSKWLCGQISSVFVLSEFTGWGQHRQQITLSPRNRFKLYFRQDAITTVVIIQDPDRP